MKTTEVALLLISVSKCPFHEIFKIVFKPGY